MTGLPRPEPADPLSPESLSSLVVRVVRGEAAAEEQIVELFQRRIYVMMLARTREGETARDLAQETLMAVLTAVRAGRVREPERLGAFVLGTARNIASNYLRARWLSPAEVPITPEVASIDPHRDIEAADRVAVVRRALASFDPIDRAILSLTLFEGLKPGEIAPKVGLSPEAVRTRKSRAVQRVVEGLRTAGGTLAVD